MTLLAVSLTGAWFAVAFLFRGRLAPVLLPDRPEGSSSRLLFSPGPVAPPTSAAPPEPRTTGPPWTDLMLPAALALWLGSLRVVNIEAVDDWGLLHALPVLYFVALGLLVASIAVALTRPALSVVRLLLHLVALVVVLHGTVPLLFPEPNYPWVYKHIGVTDYINSHGGLDPSVDIYHHWPGFFAVAAWFTSMAGAGSPLEFAKWAPVYFNLLFCLELAFVYRWLPLGRRERWLGLFLFAAANWVGQDYFAPQALAFLLSLGVFGMMLAWLRADTNPAPVRLVRRMARRVFRATAPPVDEAAAEPRPAGWLRVVALGSLFCAFAVVIVAHQLSPFLILMGVGILVAAGLIRPRWVVAVLAVLALGYFALHVSYLRSDRHLAGSPFDPREILSALNNPFDNASAAGFDATDPMFGRWLTALGAPVLILGLWALGSLGALRRFRAGRSTLLLAVLAASPALVAVAENYGGEAIFRIYLFSLPWTAALAACALAPRLGATWGAAAAIRIGLALCVVVTLFMSAFYGSVELYRVRPGAVAASQYYFDHAPPGSTLGLLAPNVPGRIAANYDEYVTGTAPQPLSTMDELRHHVLGPADLPFLNTLYREHVPWTTGGLYLSLSRDQETYVRVLGLMPEGAVAGLEAALAESPDWQVFYRNADAVIYEFIGR